jgi:glycosyltransferase involved in cell wall biosynthesis
VGIVLKRKYKFPLQIQIHTDFYSKEFYDGNVLNWFQFEMSRFTIKRADGFRVVRKKIAEDLVNHFHIDEKKISILPIFIDIDKIRDYPITVNLRRKYPQWEFVALIASRLSPEKDIPIALKAFRKFVSKYAKVGLVIVGQGVEEEKLKRMVGNMGLEKNVSFESWQQDITSYYKTVDLFINTSHFEGYGMTLVEAASAGCPILTTNVGIAQDVFEDGKNALICPPHDSDCLTNKLITFFENTSIRKNITNNIVNDIRVLALTKDEYLERQKKSFDILFS